MTRRQTWILFTVYLLSIYATLPVMRDVVNFVKSVGAVDPITYGINVAAAGTLCFVVYREYSSITLRNGLILICLSGLLGYMVYRAKWPAERIHFVQYGALGAIAYLGFSFDFSPFNSLILAILLASGGGWLDEGIQHLLPRRHYNIHDVAYNAIGAFIGSMTLYAGLPNLAQSLRSN